MKAERKMKRNELETLEKKYNDAVIRIKSIENTEISAKRDVDLMKAEMTSKDKELAYL